MHHHLRQSGQGGRGGRSWMIQSTTFHMRDVFPSLPSLPKQKRVKHKYPITTLASSPSSSRCPCRSKEHGLARRGYAFEGTGSCYI